MLGIKENMTTMNQKIFQNITIPASAGDEIEEQIVSATAQTVADIVKERSTKAQGTRKERSHLKVFWNHGYNNWSKTEFKEQMSVGKAKFDLILNRISANIYKTNTYQHGTKSIRNPLTTSNDTVQIRSRMFFADYL